jgi:hypothetical protein
MATIPLRLMHDIFDKLPLAKGIYMRLILNLNAQSQVVLNTDGAAYTGIASVSSPNGVLPFQISPMGTGNGFVATGATQITASLGIGKSVVPTTINHASGITQCRVYCAVYDMSPLYEEKFLSMVPTKTIKYNDILSFQVTNVQGGASFSQILTNGVSRARYLLICPQLSSVVNGATTILNTTTNSNFQLGSPMNSPFSSAPGTCCPFAFVNNFNVLVSGSAIYQSNYNYRYEQFLQEIRPSQGLNGGLSLGMSSGIIGQSDWENAYGWIYVDLSRKISQASDDISRSIQIVGTNASGVNVDYYCIIGYEREITLSTATGSLVI